MDRMPSIMQYALGYDEFGNNERLLAAADAEVLERGTWKHADQNVVCRCGYSYVRHPKVQGALWLTRTCEGIVKL